MRWASLSAPKSPRELLENRWRRSASRLKPDFMTHKLFSFVGKLAVFPKHTFPAHPHHCTVEFMFLKKFSTCWMFVHFFIVVCRDGIFRAFKSTLGGGIGIVFRGESLTIFWGLSLMFLGRFLMKFELEFCEDFLRNFGVQFWCSERSGNSGIY